MAYATVAHVNSYNVGRSYSATSHPTASQVIQYLEDSQGEIDTILTEVGYDLPVPDGATSALFYLRGVNALHAAYKVEESAQASERREQYRLMWEAAKKALGTVELTGVAKSSDQTRPRFSTASPPFFTRDMVL